MVYDLSQSVADLFVVDPNRHFQIYMYFCYAAMKHQCYKKTHGQVHCYSMPQISEAFQSMSLIAAASSTSRVSLARRNWVQTIGQSRWLSWNGWKMHEHGPSLETFCNLSLPKFSTEWWWEDFEHVLSPFFFRPDKFQICYEHCAAVRQLLFCRSCGCLDND